MEESGLSSSTIGAIIAIIIVGVIVLYIVASILSKKCPKCKKLGLKKIEKKEVGRYYTTKKIKDEEKDKNGNVIRTLEKHVPITVHEFEDTYQCKFCGQKVVRKHKEEKTRN